MKSIVKGNVGLHVGDGEVSTITYKTKMDCRLCFSNEGWNYFVQIEQDLHLGQAMVITARGTTHRNRLPVICH
jgi:hypothetical protein